MSPVVTFFLSLLVFRGVKGFIVEMSDSTDGPWTKIVEGEFSDPSREEDITEFPLREPQTGQFVNFRCVSWYRQGCLLQYIGFGLDFEEPCKYYKGCLSQG